MSNQILPFPTAGIYNVVNYTDPTTGLNCSHTVTTQACPLGSFCPQPTSAQSFECPPGFWCPNATALPAYCCKGFYCPTPSEIVLCPSGSFCPEGSIAPQSCLFLASCPPGTQFVYLVGVFGLYAIFAIVAFIVFKIVRMVQTRRKKQSRRLSLLSEKAGMLSSSFESLPDTRAQVEDFRFESLSKILPNGKTILNNVSGELRVGKVCAVMGPSGSGKTTLVSVLCGKTSRSSGQIILNGQEDELVRLSKLVGYVPQEDTMHRDLPIIEILQHSAKVRLPRDWTDAQRMDKVKEIMEYLSLTAIADSKVGDERKRGVSGGQRKRVNIAMELVAQPSVLFLDEPTSGLDSTTANQLSALMSKIAADKGIIVAAIIHSPSQQSFEMFSDLILLGTGGRMVYAGPREYALSYFETLGFVKSPHQTEPDFFMDVVSDKEKLAHNPFFKSVDLFEYWDAFASEEPVDEASMIEISKHNRQQEQMAEVVMAKPAGFASNVRNYMADLIKEMNMSLEAVGRKDQVRVTPTWARIFVLCARRARSQIWQSWVEFMGEMTFHFLAGFFISLASQGLEYLGKFPNEMCVNVAFPLSKFCLLPQNTLPQVGVFVSLGALFSGISIGANTFGKEMEVYWRDVAGGLPTLPYFLAKVMVDIPRIILGGIVFTVALNFGYPLRGSLLLSTLTVISLYYVAFAYGYLISTMVRREHVGMLATAFALLWALVLGGVVPQLVDVNNTTTRYNRFRLLWDISAPRYAIEAFFLAQTQPLPWTELRSNRIYTLLGYRIDSFNQSIFNVFLIGSIWMIVSLIMLKLRNRNKQR